MTYSVEINPRHPSANPEIKTYLQDLEIDAREAGVATKEDVLSLAIYQLDEMIQAHEVSALAAFEIIREIEHASVVVICDADM